MTADPVIENVPCKAAIPPPVCAEFPPMVVLLMANLSVLHTPPPNLAELLATVDSASERFRQLQIPPPRQFAELPEIVEPATESFPSLSIPPPPLFEAELRAIVESVIVTF